MASREQLMARILELLGEVEHEIESTVRNRGLMTDEKRPAQVLLDGDERVRVSLQSSRRQGRAATMAPQIMEAFPQIFYLPKEKRPRTDANPANIGTEANEWRDKVLVKIWNDTTLASLLGSNGSLVYNGCETDLKSGSAMSGEIRLDLTMTYVLQPTA